MTAVRRLAVALVRRATAALPPSQRHWGEAMGTELSEIPSDLQALRWALGAARTSRRLRTSALAAAKGHSIMVYRLISAACLLPLLGVLTLIALELHAGLNTTQDGPAAAHGLGVVMGVTWGIPLALLILAARSLGLAYRCQEAGLPDTARRWVVRTGQVCVITAPGLLWIALNRHAGLPRTIDDAMGLAFGTIYLAVPWVALVAVLQVRYRLAHPGR